MALFSMRVQVIKRSAGRSAVAAAAYRAGERLHDDRQNLTHDYSRRSGVERTEIFLPDHSPAWTQGMGREALWNRVEAGEKRKDAQVAREIRVMIPRELPASDRVALVRGYVQDAFVSRGMIADVAWHNKTATDGRDQPHAHIMLTMRPLTDQGFGKKSRHDMIPDPSGRTRPDGRPVLVPSNTDSWNLDSYYEETCRKGWEERANAALARIGSAERIDRRSLLERGIARLPEPALRLAHYLKDLHGVMRERFGQFQMARHYRSVEDRAKAALTHGDKRALPGGEAASLRRYFDWFDRQLARLAPPPPRQPDRTRPTPNLER